MGKTLQRLLSGCLLLICCLPLLVLAADPSSGELSEETPVALKVANRSITVFRATLLSESPTVRAARAHAVITEVLENSQNLQVSVQPVQLSYMVLLGGRRSFFISPKDVDPLLHESLAAAANAAAENLRQVVAETQESHNLRFMLKALGYCGLATLVFVLLLRAIYYLRGKLLNVLPGLMQRQAKVLKVGSTQVVDSHQLYPLVSRVLHALRWLVMLLLGYEWLSFVLSRFPYTRPWGENLNSYLLDVASYLFEGGVSAVPGLGVALAIFFIARWVSSFAQRLLRRMAAQGNSEGWLNSETLQPTRRLTALAIWFFALAWPIPTCQVPVLMRSRDCRC
jgi:hypothetical protein